MKHINTISTLIIALLAGCGHEGEEQSEVSAEQVVVQSAISSTPAPLSNIEKLGEEREQQAVADDYVMVEAVKKNPAPESLANDEGFDDPSESETQSSTQVQQSKCDYENWDDSDQDGLPDEWEINGVDRDCDGIVELDLPSLGANPYRKDIFIEIDYMVSGDLSYAPTQAAIDHVFKAFQNAPKTNPDGSTGIEAHIFLSDALPFKRVLYMNDDYQSPMCSGPSEDKSSMDEVQDQYFDKSKKGIFYYVAFAHYATCQNAKDCSRCQGYAPFGATGLGEVRGMRSMVTFGFEVDFPPQNKIPQGSLDRKAAGVLLHELGHNFGLLHGGGDRIDRKLNYYSVMNRMFTFNGIPHKIDGPDEFNFELVVDFSREKLKTLDEKKLDESINLESQVAMWGSVVPCAGWVPYVTNAAGIDWNCDGDTDDKNISLDITLSGGLEELHGHDDWESINLGWIRSQLRY